MCCFFHGSLLGTDSLLDKHTLTMRTPSISSLNSHTSHHYFFKKKPIKKPQWHDWSGVAVPYAVIIRALPVPTKAQGNLRISSLTWPMRRSQLSFYYSSFLHASLIRWNNRALQNKNLHEVKLCCSVPKTCTCQICQICTFKNYCLLFPPISIHGPESVQWNIWYDVRILQIRSIYRWAYRLQKT